jgi:hypothetical protein
MRALSIRQPYAELIPSASSGQALRGIKTDFGELSRAVELRSRSTRIVGERFYIYAGVGGPARRRAAALAAATVPEPGALPTILLTGVLLTRSRRRRNLPLPA